MRQPCCPKRRCLSDVIGRHDARLSGRDFERTAKLEQLFRLGSLEHRIPYEGTKFGSAFRRPNRLLDEFVVLEPDCGVPGEHTFAAGRERQRLGLQPGATAGQRRLEIRPAVALAAGDIGVLGNQGPPPGRRHRPAPAPRSVSYPTFRNGEASNAFGLYGGYGLFKSSLICRERIIPHNGAAEVIDDL